MVAPDVIDKRHVSAAYGYTALTKELRKVLPNVVILLGGNLGASATAQKSRQDFVAVGEGERTSSNF